MLDAKGLEAAIDAAVKDAPDGGIELDIGAAITAYLQAVGPEPVGQISEEIADAVREAYRRKVAEYDRDFRDPAMSGEPWKTKYGTNLHSTSLGEQWAMSQALRSALVANPPAEPVEGADYFGSLVEKARLAAAKASAKFPQPNYVTLKIAEEAGEVVRGAVHYAEKRMAWDEVEGEIVQLIAMLFRFVTEGDQINGVIPPATLATKPAVKDDETVVEALPNWTGWRSIDTAPEDCRVLLATAGSWVGEAIMLRDEDTGEQVWTWVDTGKPSLHSCYGWMPLPEHLLAPVLSDLRPDGFDGPTGAE